MSLQGVSALMGALANGHGEVVILLVDAGADVDASTTLVSLPQWQTSSDINSTNTLMEASFCLPVCALIRTSKYH